MRMRAVTCVLATLLVLVCTTEATNPGMKIRFTETGMKYVADKSLSALTKALSSLPTLPSASGDIVIMQYKIGNATMTPNGTSTSNITVTSDGMKKSIEMAKIDIAVPYSGTFWLLFIPIAFEGNVTGSTGNVKVEQTIKLGATSAGKMSVAASACTSSIENLNLKVTGGFDWLFNLFFDPFFALVSFLAGPQICTAMDALINIGVNGGLDAIPMKLSITNKIAIDYSLTAPPTYMTDYVDIGIKGEFSEVGSSTPSALTPASLTLTSGTDRMMYIEVGEYMLGTLSETLYKTGVLVYSHPNPVASVSALSAPIINFVPDGLNVTLAGRVDTTVNGSDVHFNATISILMNASFSDNTIKFGLGPPTVDTSAPSVPGFDVDAMVNGGLLDGIIGALNSAVGDGIPIPPIPMVSFNNSAISFGADSMVIAVDITISDSLLDEPLNYMPQELDYRFAVNTDTLTTTTTITTTTPRPPARQKARNHGQGSRGNARRPRSVIRGWGGASRPRIF